jgi:biopolymer transport protein ExbD
MAERRRAHGRRSDIMAVRLGKRSDGDDLDIQHEINVTPFIDVILVLLIIFMVAAPLATVDIGVNLPASTAPEQPRPDKPVFVTIKPDQTIAVGETVVAREGLTNALGAATNGHKDETIFVRADKSLSYGELMDVMNILRDAGYLKLALVGLETPAEKK